MRYGFVGGLTTWAGEPFFFGDWFCYAGMILYSSSHSCCSILSGGLRIDDAHLECQSDYSWLFQLNRTH